MATAPRLAIIVPCYKESEALPASLKTLLGLLDEYTGRGLVAGTSYIMCVDDGSPDDTWHIIEQAHMADPRVKGIRLAHNRGHQSALLAGVDAVAERCDAAVTIDADLQDDPRAIEKMLAHMADGAEIVYGVRSSRESDTWFKRTSAQTFYKLQRIMGLETIYNHADYRLMSQRAIQHLCRFRERNLFLRGLVPLIGYQTDSVYYNRDKRFAGESKYPFRKMLNFAIDGITSFSVKPVRMIFWIGCIFILVALCVTGWTLHSYTQHNAVPGWSSLMISVWLVGGVILVSLGIVGEYIGKIYIEVKDRPRYNEEELLMPSGKTE